MPFTETRTQRLILRDLEPSDAGRIFAYRSRPEVARFQSWGTESQDDIQSYIGGHSGSDPGVPGLWYQVGISLQSGRQLIGDCGFHVLKTDPGQAEIGIALAPESQGQGYAAEALRALLNYLLIDLGKYRVFSSVDPRNFRSLALMERIGMRKEAHFIKSLWFKDEWVDDMIFAMLGSSWESAGRESSVRAIPTDGRRKTKHPE
jgi:RimJ/RimL family protein N-acetyltransferase